MKELRDVFITRVAKGKSFADVGGLWGTINEKVSVAHSAGATELCMMDVLVKGEPLWQMFRDRMAEKGIGEVREIVGDVCDAPDVSFDVVHCSGVIYHHPNPWALILALRRITREHLVLTSAITREVIENERGTYRIPPSGILFVPALNEEERHVLDLHWREAGADVYGITRKVEFDARDYTPWWFLPTPTSMRAMAESCGFKVLDGGPFWNDNAHTLLLQVK